MDPQPTTLFGPVKKLWLPIVVDGLMEVNPETKENALPNRQARSLRPFASSNGVALSLRDYLFPSSDSEFTSGAKVEFLYMLAGLPVVRSTDPRNEDPRLWDIWRFDLKDVKLQKGGVTLLNNVFNPERGEQALVMFHMEDSGVATIQIFALDGSIVKVLNRGRQAAGDYEVLWDGRNEGGRIVARGPYFLRVVAPGVDEVRTLLVGKDSQ